MKKSPSRSPSLCTPWILTLLSLAFFFFTADMASAASFTPAKRPRPRRVVRRPPPPAPAPLPSGVEGRESLIQAPPAPIVTTASSTVSATDLRVQENPPRIVNLRVHPIHWVYMIAQKDTVVSLRGDLDFVLSDKVTIGPSVIYHQTDSLDDLLLANGGNARYIDLGVLELGMLSNIYLTGTTASGGFLLRPHVYWISATGSKADGDGGNVATATRTTSGIRGGAEFLFQKILSNGFNFEIGGGLTYHFARYGVEYTNDGGTTKSDPGNLLVPTISLGVGWAF